MSVAVGPKPVPSVPVQVLRAALGTLTVAALVAGLVWGWGYAGSWASDRWARAFGDPSLRLAEGVTLSDQPVHSGIVTMTTRTLDGDAGGASLRAAFGSPVREAVGPEEVVALLGGTWTVADVRSWSPGTRWLVTPAGVVSWAPATEGSTAILGLHGGGSVVAATPQARADVLRRWVSALGATSGSAASRLVLDVSEEQEGDHVRVSARWRLAGSEPWPAMGSVDTALFTPSGRLMSGYIVLASASAVRDVTVQSPAAAWDDLRHHRVDGDWRSFMGTPSWAEATSAQLQPGIEESGGPGTGLALPPTWVFLDQYDQAQFLQRAAEVAG